MKAVTNWRYWYRVDTVPSCFRSVYELATTALGIIQYQILHNFVKATSVVTVERANPAQENTYCIYAVWHSEVYAFLTSMGNVQDLAIINHPYWYMRPTHVSLKLLGVKEIFLGSTGHGGKEAVDQLAARLAAGGRSTFINPDGPNGPSGLIRKGIFHLALKSGLPIIPVRIEASNHFRLSGWDQKLIPLPFGRIKVRILEHIYVTSGDFTEANARLATMLGPPLTGNSDFLDNE
jgi:lysophospholipid acyltransferase (LPLAT)-like uncharacterized protein